MSESPYLEPRRRGDRFRSTEQQRHLRIWAECHGAEIRCVRQEGNDLVGAVLLDGCLAELRTPVENPFGWRARSRTKHNLQHVIFNMRKRQ